MRRTLLALSAAFVVALTGCSTTGTPSASESSPAALSTTAAPNTEFVCEGLDLVLEAGMKNVGEALGEYFVFKQNGKEAGTKAAEENVKKKLTAAADGVAQLGATATDPGVKAKFDEVAANMKKSADLTFLTGVTSAEGLTEPLHKEAIAWLTPIMQLCGIDNIQ